MLFSGLGGVDRPPRKAVSMRRSASSLSNFSESLGQDMARLTDRCIFCGETDGLNGEHLFWPTWSYKYIPNRPARTHQRTGSMHSRSSPHIWGIHKTTRHHGGVNTIKLPVVCEDRCNNGWMRRLENATIPILVPLIIGKRIKLTKHAQQKLARWVAMKTMTTEFLEPERAVTPENQRFEFRARRKIPDRWQVYIARQRGAKWETELKRTSSRLGVPSPRISPNAQCVTVGFGKLLIIAISVSAPNFNYKLPANIRQVLNQIWPYSTDVLWPPQITLTDADIEIISMAMHHAAMRLPWADVPQTMSDPANHTLET
jgi:hypothetical protein